MAGHSKWANIQHRKGKQDAIRSKMFSKLSKEITVAAKMGDPDPDKNPRLRLAVKAAKAVSMPKDVIDRAIKKSQMGDAGDYTEIRYEGYGANGIAIIVEAMTDNLNRTASNVRSYFTKAGGNMGQTGSVSHSFDRLGEISYPLTAGDADTVMMAAIEAGAEDVATNDDGSIEVLTAPNDFIAVKDALEAAGFKPEFGEVTMKPEGENVFTGDDAVKMQKLLDALENLDDVQEVYTNALIES